MAVVSDAEYGEFESLVSGVNPNEKLFVKFYIKPVKDKQASKKEGRPIYRDTEYIDIRTPGSRDGIARVARPSDKARFPRHYALFKQRIEEQVCGTLLSEWGVISRSQAEELAFFNIKTIEQLAELGDNHAQRFAGIHALKQKAQAWIKQSKENASFEKVQAELAQRDETIKGLTKKLADLEKRLENITPLKQKYIKRKSESS